MSKTRRAAAEEAKAAHDISTSSLPSVSSASSTSSISSTTISTTTTTTTTIITTTSSTSTSTSSSSSSSSTSSTTTTAAAGLEWMSSPQLLAGGVGRKRRQAQPYSTSHSRSSASATLSDSTAQQAESKQAESGENENENELERSTMKQGEASPSTPDSPQQAGSPGRFIRNALLLSLFLLSLAALYHVASSFPALKPEERAVIRWPRSYSDVNEIAIVLRRYKTDHFSEVLTAFVALYIFLQAFAIPGAIFLSLLAGPLFGRWYGLGLVSVVATSGASCCFLLSRLLGRHLVERCFPQLLASTRRRIQSHRHNLFFYLLFLRISPLLPNWFISVSSPLLDVPLHIFVAATFFGLIPANYIHVSTGLAVEELAPDQSQGSIKIQWRSLFALLAIACFALLPTLFKRKLEDVEHRLEDKPLKPIKTA